MFKSLDLLLYYEDMESAGLSFNAKEAAWIVEYAQEEGVPVYYLALVSCLARFDVSVPAARRIIREVFLESRLQKKSPIEHGYELVLQQLVESGYWEVYEANMSEGTAYQKLVLVEDEMLNDVVGLDFVKQYLNAFVGVFRAYLQRIAHRYTEDHAVSKEALLADAILTVTDEQGETLISQQTQTILEELGEYLNKITPFQNWQRTQKK